MKQNDELWIKYGINKKCASCVKKCKQHDGCILLSCPNYIEKSSSAQNKKKKNKTTIKK